MPLPRGQTAARAGSLVAAAGGLAYVLINAPAAGDDRSLLLRLAGVGVFVSAVVEVLRTERLGDGRTPDRGQVRRVGWIIAAEALAIPVGANLLVRAAGIDLAALPWVTTVVGVHFLWFARVLPGAGFLGMGALVATLGVVGLVLAVVGGSAGAIGIVSGLVAGFVLMMAVIRGVHLGADPAT